MNKILTSIGIAVSAVIVASMVYFYVLAPPTLPTKEFTQLTPSKKVVGVTQHSVSVSSLKVYDKEQLSKRIELPEPLLKDARKQVTAVVDVPPTKAGAEVISVTDLETGETTLHAKAKPVPLFGFENQKRIGVGYGVSSGGSREMKVFGEYTFGRVGNFYASLYSEVKHNSNKGPDAGAGVQVDYRF